MSPRYERPSADAPPVPEERAYFFDEGIRFECTRCGACCSGAPGQVLVTPEEIARLAARLGMAEAEFVQTRCRPIPEGYSLRERANGDCVLLEEGRCSVHADKPMQCATYPFWINNLRNETRWEKTRRDCEGIGRGPLYTREDILRIVNHQDTAS